MNKLRSFALTVALLFPLTLAESGCSPATQQGAKAFGLDLAACELGHAPADLVGFVGSAEQVLLTDVFAQIARAHPGGERLARH